MSSLEGEAWGAFTSSNEADLLFWELEILAGLWLLSNAFRGDTCADFYGLAIMFKSSVWGWGSAWSWLPSSDHIVKEQLLYTVLGISIVEMLALFLATSEVLSDIFVLAGALFNMFFLLRLAPFIIMMDISIVVFFLCWWLLMLFIARFFGISFFDVWCNELRLLPLLKSIVELVERSVFVDKKLVIWVHACGQMLNV